MSILKNPTEIVETVRLAGLIYGQPGVGKTTLALSAPNPVMIDADNSMRRVEKRFQVPSLPLTDYGVLLKLFESSEIDPFETIVFDTLGRLVERIGDYLAAADPTSRQKDGSLSIKGFGRLKVEFQRLLRMAQERQKHLVFVAHDREERDGETRIIRPDAGPGSSGKDLVKDLDFMGYMEMRGNSRTISFTPCERFYAKNSLQLPSVINVPDIKDGNSFIRDFVLERALDRMQEDAAENHRYIDLIGFLNETIDGVVDADSADKALASINTSEVIWDSLRYARRRLAEKTKELGLIYDRATKRFDEPATPARSPKTEIVA